MLKANLRRPLDASPLVANLVSLCQKYSHMTLKTYFGCIDSWLTLEIWTNTIWCHAMVFGRYDVTFAVTVLMQAFTTRKGGQGMELHVLLFFNFSHLVPYQVRQPHSPPSPQKHFKKASKKCLVSSLISIFPLFIISFHINLSTFHCYILFQVVFGENFV